MTGMTDIKRKKHTGETGNGGEFGSKTRSEADISLTEPANTAARKLSALRQLVYDLESDQRDAAENAINEVASSYPAATRAVFNWSDDFDGSDFSFVNLLDADGVAVDVSGKDRDNLSYYADVFDDFDTMRKASNFRAIADFSDDYYLDVNSTGDRGFMGPIEARGIIESASALADHSGSRMAAASASVLGRISTVQFPTATALVLVDMNGDDGSPFLIPHKLLNKDGDVLWGDIHDDFADELMDYTPMLDRDMSRLSKPTEDKWVLTF